MLLSRAGQRVVVLRPGLLRTPPVAADPPWISVTQGAVWVAGARRPGWVEQALGAPAAATAEAAADAARLVREGLGGAFWARPPAMPGARRRVLVLAARGWEATARRLDAALAESPAEATTLLAERPGRWLANLAERRGCAILSGQWDPWALLDGAAAVHGDVSDPLCLLAALAGVSVRGAPLLERPRGPGELATALLAAARYADPFTGERIGPGAALDIVAEWRRVTRANRAVGACAGMSFWKRQRMRAFLHDGERPPPHRRTAREAARAAQAAGTGRGVAVWSSRRPPGLDAAVAATGGAMLLVEDGFVRSRGLGSGFLPPCSVIVDAAGIYYDPSRPSDLENLLRGTPFEPALLARARRLAGRLVREGVTKYATGLTDRMAEAVLPPSPGRRRILVPGQVADDMSVLLGGAGVAGNVGLLARVRQANPEAFVAYKPHPDVRAGHRAGAIPEAEVLRHADAVLGDVPMASCIEAVDEVHTLTSLAGFEALLRGRRVVVHGQPFYAGWGLTTDLAPLPRRDRRLTLDELCAGVLLLYPRYLDPVTGLPCPAEVLLDRLADRTLWRETRLMRLRRLQGVVRGRLRAGMVR